MDDRHKTGSVNQPNRLFSLSHKRFVECTSLDGALRQSQGKYVENRQVVYADLEVSETFARTKVSDSNLISSKFFHFSLNHWHFSSHKFGIHKISLCRQRNLERKRFRNPGSWKPPWLCRIVRRWLPLTRRTIIYRDSWDLQAGANQFCVCHPCNRFG